MIDSTNGNEGLRENELFNFLIYPSMFWSILNLGLDLRRTVLSQHALLEPAEGKKPETAIELYAQAEQYLNNEGIFYPIYYEKRYYAIAPRLTGIIVHPYDMGIDFMHAAKT